MNQRLSISIGKPCSEKFSQFTPTASGGFCSACKKDVIDFRNMSDDTLLAYFKTSEAHTCGYFKTSQLKEYAPSMELKKTAKSNYLKVVGLALLSAVSLHSLPAQEPSTPIEIVENTNPTTRSGLQNSRAIQTRLTGIVLDASGPLPGANVLLKNTSIGTATNLDGAFEFPQALKEGDILVFSYLGYITKEVEIKNNQSPLTVTMDEDMIFMMGEVDVNEVYKSKRSIWQKIKDIF